MAVAIIYTDTRLFILLNACFMHPVFIRDSVMIVLADSFTVYCEPSVFSFALNNQCRQNIWFTKRCRISPKTVDQMLSNNKSTAGSWNIFWFQSDINFRKLKKKTHWVYNYWDASRELNITQFLYVLVCLKFCKDQLKRSLYTFGLMLISKIHLQTHFNHKTVSKTVQKLLDITET